MSNDNYNLENSDFYLNTVFFQNHETPQNKVQLNVHSQQQDSYTIAFPKFKPNHNDILVYSQTERAFIWVSSVGFGSGTQGQNGTDGKDGKNAKKYFTHSPEILTKDEIKKSISINGSLDIEIDPADKNKLAFRDNDFVQVYVDKDNYFIARIEDYNDGVSDS
eukprot:Pgem_evm1s19024